MKIQSITIENFRGYKNPTTIAFNDITVIVGKNDIGKSTILEALDLFFNDGKGAIKFDKKDLCVSGTDANYTVSVTFTDLPGNVVVDDTYQTDLASEYLVDSNGNLTITKIYDGNKCKSVLIHALHPTNPDCADLQLKKAADLRRIITDNNIECENQVINSIMRKAIWNHYADSLELSLVDIEISKGEDTKRIWDKLSTYIPVYTLFQADRQNNNDDKEIQDPLKAAVALFFKDEEIMRQLNSIAERVEETLRAVSARTLEKLNEMSPDIANSLNPVIPSATSLKWADVFKTVSITSDDDISINKRGSGVKRLILMNFFRAEAEHRLQEGNCTGIIYAIEEPETSQHFANQRLLADALNELSRANNTQVVITTHSGIMVKQMRIEDIRVVKEDQNGNKFVTPVQSGLLVYPSLNEINYTTFDEVTEEYFDELFGFIYAQNWLNEYENEKERIAYIRQNRDGSTVNETRTKTHYIRDVLHHPENRHNRRYTFQELSEAIAEMREFLEQKQENEAAWLGEDDE